MTVALLDDHVLSAELQGRGPGLAAELHTTGLWYVRLCHAVLRARGGALAAPYADLPEPLRAPALAAVLGLPARIGLVSLRLLAPTMGQLSERHRLNLLAREALAAALLLDATVVLAASNPSPALRAAADLEGVPVRVVEV